MGNIENGFFMQPILDDLITTARQAGEILRQGYGHKHEIQHKGVIDLVTETDHLSEKLIIEAIQQKFPTHRIITEESGTLSGETDHCWYIDPLDGTVNYAHDVPLFTVSIAYVSHSQLQLGVVYEPMRDECFSAERDQGAWLNGQPLKVSRAQTLQESLLVTGFPYDMWQRPEKHLKYFSSFSVCSQGVRRLGSAALDLCYVAAGRLDGYWELNIETYDIAAGALIAMEAGAIATKVDGSSEILTPPCSMLAANPSLHGQMLTILQQD
jgi:myo-inositol-1(or 4)-monophosphatase